VTEYIVAYVNRTGAARSVAEACLYRAAVGNTDHPVHRSAAAQTSRKLPADEATPRRFPPTSAPPPAELPAASVLPTVALWTSGFDHSLLNKNMHWLFLVGVCI